MSGLQIIPSQLQFLRSVKKDEIFFVSLFSSIDILICTEFRIGLSLGNGHVAEQLIHGFNIYI